MHAKLVKSHCRRSYKERNIQFAAIENVVRERGNSRILDEEWGSESMLKGMDPFQEERLKWRAGIYHCYQNKVFRHDEEREKSMKDHKYYDLYFTKKIVKVMKNIKS